MSKKMPYMPLWVSDFVGDASVAAMDAAEVGAYVLLLMYQWSDGPLPTKSARLMRMARLSSRQKDKLATVLENFHMTPEGLVNKRLESIRQDQVAKMRELSKRGKAAADVRWGNNA